METKETYKMLNMPQPKGDTTYDKNTGKKRPAERLVDTLYEAQEVQLVRQQLGLDKQDATAIAPNQGNEMSKTMVELVTAFSKSLADMAGQITHKGDNQQENQLVSWLWKEVQDTRAKLENNQQNQNPLDMIQLMDGFYQKINDWKKDVKKDLGLPDSVAGAGGISDTSALLQLEQMKSDREMQQIKFQEEMRQRSQEFDLRMKELERQWQREDQVAMAESERKRRKDERMENAFSQLQDLVGSIVESLEPNEGRGSSAQPERQPVRSTAQPAKNNEEITGENIPVSFTCDICESQVMVDQENKTAVCAQCGTEYNLTPDYVG